MMQPMLPPHPAFCRPRPSLVLSSVVSLLLASTAWAQEPATGSLAERRLAITKGTAPGKVVIEAPKPAASSASAPAAGGQTGFFSRLPPPTGRPLSAARRLDAADQGIRLPTAGTAASAPAAAR